MKGRIVQINEHEYKIQVKSLLFWVDIHNEDPIYSKGIDGRKCIYATVQQAEEDLFDYLVKAQISKSKVVK